jgi:hypothetical protein
LQQRIRQLIGSKRLGKIIEPAGQEIDQLVGLYEEAIYSADPACGATSAFGSRAWKGLRWRLWLARLGRKQV